MDRPASSRKASEHQRSNVPARANLPPDPYVRIRTRTQPPAWRTFEESIFWPYPVLISLFEDYRRVFKDRPDIVLLQTADKLITPIIEWIERKHNVGLEQDDYDWEESFFARHISFLPELISAALDLSVDKLAVFGAQWIAKELRGKGHSEVQRLLGIATDLSKEEDEVLAQENALFALI